MFTLCLFSSFGDSHTTWRWFLVVIATIRTLRWRIFSVAFLAGHKMDSLISLWRQMHECRFLLATSNDVACCTAFVVQDNYLHKRFQYFLLSLSIRINLFEMVFELRLILRQFPKNVQEFGDTFIIQLPALTEFTSFRYHVWLWLQIIFHYCR